MKKLFSPWRSNYINSFIKKKQSGCIFCDCAKSKNDEKNLILYRGKFNFVIMNLFPYNNGHLMVVPYGHFAEMKKINGKTASEIHDLINKSIFALNKTIKPHGFNIGINLGRASGAGIENHIHYHIVPRWNGDTNFMPVLSETKIISEEIKKTFNKLKPYFNKK